MGEGSTSEIKRGRKKRIGVLLGGDCAERAVSLATGEAVLAALVERGWDAQAIYVDHDLDLCLRQARIDTAFIALHGHGSDGAAQGLLESLGVPYTGPSLAAASLAADKLRTKELLRLHNLPTPAYYIHSRSGADAASQHGSFGFPCAVKPRSGAAGIGVARADGPEELDAAIETALRFDDDVLVERWVTAREVQAVLLDGQLLGIAEVMADGGVLDYAARHTPGRTQVMVPPRLSAERLAGAITLATRVYDLLGLTGIARIDLLVSDAGNEFVLEANALPDLGPSSLVPKLAHAAGLDFGELCERLVDGARLHRRRHQVGRAVVKPAWNTGERRAAGAADPH